MTKILMPLTGIFEKVSNSLMFILVVMAIQIDNIYQLPATFFKINKKRLGSMNKFFENT